MHRIDGPGATVDNKFTDGDPLGGVQATVVTDDWMNDVQENIIAVLTAAGVVPTKGRAADLLDSIGKVATGRLLRTTIYINNSGVLQASVDGGAFVNASSTFTKHPLAQVAEVEVQGGGGSGGNAVSTSASQCAAGSGGAGGGWASKRFAIAAINGQTVTVGAGGAAGTPAAGGSTTVGVLLSASGGGPGVTGTNQTPNTTPFEGRPGGTGVGGDLNGQGGYGFASIYSATPVSGKGGSSRFGEGGAPVAGPGTTGINGVNSVSPGAGGSGAANGVSVPSTRNGGAGSSGLAIFREYS